MLRVQKGERFYRLRHLKFVLRLSLEGKVWREKSDWERIFFLQLWYELKLKNIILEGLTVVAKV